MDFYRIFTQLAVLYCPFMHVVGIHNSSILFSPLPPCACLQEVFQLIVSSFENLSDKSSRSYAKRTSILETVAKVRSCVVMLDLECDALIIEMFQHFLEAIRYENNVFG